MRVITIPALSPDLIEAWITTACHETGEADRDFVWRVLKVACVAQSTLNIALQRLNRDRATQNEERP